jgi:hypothetical protein
MDTRHTPRPTSLNEPGVPSRMTHVLTSSESASGRLPCRFGASEAA